jgi:hypothetical protein
MFDHMSQIDGIELATLGDQPIREFLRQVTRMDLVPLLAGDGGSDRIGLYADDLLVAGATENLQQRAVVTANVDRPSRILARHRRGDQILKVSRLLEPGRIGIRVGIDQVRRYGVDDLQQAAILAALEMNGKPRVRIISPLSEIVRDRKIVQLEKE